MAGMFLLCVAFVAVLIPASLWAFLEIVSRIGHLGQQRARLDKLQHELDRYLDSL